MKERLSAAWLEGMGTPGTAAAPDRLEAALAALLVRARATLPTLPLAAFLRTAARAAATSDPERIAKLHAPDLLLAAAALERDPAALEILDRQYLSLAAGAVAGLGGSDHFADELRQTLREKLLVGREGRPPALGSYTGSGPLAAWVRVSARRLALNLLEARSQGRSDEDELLALPSPEADPELRLLRERSGGEIKRAVHDALATLSTRERLMLRMHYLDGVSMTQIAKTYGLHQSNVSRTLAAARDFLMGETRRLLAERLRLRPSELDSLVGLVSSGLDLSLSRALQKAE